MSYNDSMGVTLTKPTPSGFRVDMDEYDRAIEWVKDHIKTHFGIHIVKVLLECNHERWFFYEVENEPTISLPHEMMNRILNSLEQLEWLAGVEYVDPLPDDDDDDDTELANWNDPA